MIVFNDRLHGYVLGKATGVAYNPDVDVCIASEIDGKLIGGVVYNNYTGASIHIHVAAFRPRWLCRDGLWVVFDYPFNQLGVKKLFGTICEINSKSLEFARKLGFRVEARISEVYPDGDMILVSMKRDECPWLHLRPRAIQSGSLVSGK